MLNRVFSAVIFVLLLVTMLIIAFDVQVVNAAGTIYIRADGSIDPPTAPISTVDNVTYTLTGNITSDGDGMVVERDSIMVDGSGYTVQGTGASDSKGISHSGRNNVTIKNTKIRNFYCGIWLARAPYYAESSHYNSISGNTITNNSYGVHLYGSSNNSISGNEITNNGIGIYPEQHSNFNSVSGNNLTNNGSGLENGWDSSDNSISGNNIVNNSDVGIRFYGASLNNVVSGNLFANDGLFVEVSYGNLIVEDNFVNGKPLVYLEGVSHQSVGEAGQVILVNCEHMQVKNLSLSQTTIGIELWNTNNTMVSGNTIAGNRKYGIYLSGSSNNNTMTGNNITNTTADRSIDRSKRGYGILLDSTSNNTISGNNITNNDYGIELWYSKYNTISGNNITANGWNGIELYSTNNNVTGNNITNNGYDIWNGYGVVDSSSNNTISGNNINGNGKTAQGGGIWLYISSSNGTVSGNNITNNYYGIYLLDSSNNSVYHNNFIDNTRQVYSSDSANANVWDDSYPSGGNYWSDYTGSDANHDGIGDTPYVIDANNTDHYPLMNIIPEFPSFLILPLFFIATLLAVIVHRRKHVQRE